MRKLLCVMIALMASCAYARHDKAEVTCFNGGMITYKGCGYRFDRQEEAFIFTECQSGDIIYMFDSSCVIHWRNHNAAKKVSIKGSVQK